VDTVVVADDEGSRRVKDDDVEKACSDDNTASDDAIMKRVVRKFIVSISLVWFVFSSYPPLLLIDQHLPSGNESFNPTQTPNH
jgi:hypothetical protein